MFGTRGVASYTNTIEFKAKDAQIKSAVDKLAKSLGVIDKLVDGINGKFVKGLRGSVGAISKELKTTVKVANDLSKAFSSAQKQSKKVNVEISKTEKGLLRALSAVKSTGGAVNVSAKPKSKTWVGTENQGILDAQDALKDFLASAAKADRVFANTEIGLTKQIAGFKGLAASINVSKTAIKGKTEEYKLFMNAVRGQAIAEQNLLRIERERIAARKSLIAGEGLGLAAGPGGTYESIKDILGREGQMGNTLADINLYKSELEEALQFIERGTEEYLQTEAAIERINVDLGKVTKKERERKNELKESGKIVRNLVKDLGKLGGRGIKEFLGVLGGKRGMLPQLAGGAVGLKALQDSIKFVPFLDKKVKAHIRTYAELGQKATAVLGGIKLASIGLSGALGATTWVVDAIKGFVQFEDAAFETFHRIQGGMDKTFSFFARFARELPQLMSSAMMVMPQAFGLGVGGGGLGIKDAFGFMHEGSAAKKIMEGGQWTLERQERARFAQQGPTKLQKLKEELDWQQKLITNRNTGSKDFMTIQKKILQLELRIRKEEANRLKTRQKLNGVVSKELQIEARKALTAQRTAAIAADDRAALLAQRETDSVEFRGRRVSRGGWRRFQQMKKNRKERRERLNEGLMLGAGFPMLFGGGVGSVGGGVAGAVLQSRMGPGKGFGAQILLSALGQQLDAFVVKTKELGDALRKPTENLQALRDAAGIAGTDIDRTSKRLEQLGLKASAAALVQAEISDFANIKGLQAMSEAWQDLSNIFAKLTIQTMSFISGPLTAAIRKMEDILGHSVNAGVLKQTYEGLDQPGKDAFNRRLEQLMPERTKAGTLERFFPTTAYQKIVQGKIPPSVLKEMQAEFDPKSAPGMQADLDARIKEIAEKDTSDLQKKVELEKQRLSISSTAFEIKTKEIELARQDFEIGWQTEELDKMKAGTEKDILKTKIDKLVATRDLNAAEFENFKTLNLLDGKWQEIAGTIENGVVNAIEGAIQGTKTLGEVASSVFNQIASQLLRMGVNYALSGMFPALFPQRAEGGPVKGGSPYIVGEKGPELFVPGSSGNIVPNDAMGGANIVVNVDASGSSVEGDEAQSRELGNMLAGAIQAELVRQKRPGGLLV